MQVSSKPSPLRNVGSFVGLGLFYLVFAVLAKFWRLWLGDPSSRLFLNGDVYHEYWPDLHVAWEALRLGEWPLYNPFMNFGFPILSDAQHGLYYPASWFYFAASALFSPQTSFFVFEWVTLLPVGIFGLGMHLYLRSLGLSFGAAWIGGIVAMSTGFVNRSYYLKFMQSVAWLPWVLLALEGMIRQPNFRRAVALGLLLGLTVIAGGPPGVFYTVVLAAAYGLFRLFQESQVRSFGAVFGPFFGWLPLSGFFAVSIGLIVVLPVLDILPTTVRVGVGYSFMADSPANFSQIFGLFLPGHKSDSFHGILPWLLAVLALGLARRLAALVLFFAVLGVLGLLLSLGPFSYAIDLLYLYLPGASTFRRSIRYIYLLSVALPILAAIGFHALTSLPKPRLSRLLWPLSFFVAATLLLLVILVALPSLHLRGAALQPYLHLGFVLLTGLLLLHALASHPQSRLFFLTLLAVLLFDLYALHPNHDTSPYSSFLRWSSPVMRQQPRGPAAPYRIMNDIEDGSRNTSNLLLVRDAMNYHHPLLSRRFYSLLPWIQRDPDILRFFNIKRYLSCLPGNDHGRWCLSMHRRFSPQHWHHERSVGTLAIYQAKDPIPRVLWLPRVVLAPSEDAVLPTMQKHDPWKVAVLEPSDFPPVAPLHLASLPVEEQKSHPPPSTQRSQAAEGKKIHPQPLLFQRRGVEKATPPSTRPSQASLRPKIHPQPLLLQRRGAEKATPPRETAGLSPSSFEKGRGSGGWIFPASPRSNTSGPSGVQRGVEAVVTKAGFNGLTATIDAPKEGFVLINEVFYRDWKATLNGKPLSLIRANHLLMGAFVPQGKHTLRLTYAPRSFRIGLFFWIIGLFGGLFLLLALRRQPLAVTFVSRPV